MIQLYLLQRSRGGGGRRKHISGNSQPPCINIYTAFLFIRVYIRGSAASFTHTDPRATIVGMYYPFRQNNSRGYFKPPAINVFIEASSAEEANAKFLTLDGCYFDPNCDFDCECCGSRWSTAEEYSVLTEEEMRESITKEITIPWLSEGIPQALIIHLCKDQEILK